MELKKRTPGERQAYRDGYRQALTELRSWTDTATYSMDRAEESDAKSRRADYDCDAQKAGYLAEGGDPD